MKTFRWLVLVLMALAAVAMGRVTYTDVAALGEIDRSIAEQEATIRSIHREKAKLRKQIKAAGEEAKALPDSLRLGHSMRRAHQIAKQDQILEGRITRANARIRGFQREKARVKSHLIRWDVPLGIGLVVLSGGLVFVTRRSAR